MSPRAGSRLESLGFTSVYDYVAGKADWGSGGLPLEGENDSSTRAGAQVRKDVPTCALGEPLHAVRRRVAETGWDTCFVVDDSGVVLGRVGRRALASKADVSVDKVMAEGPSTVRPSGRLAELVERMERRKLSNLPVTTSDGRLIGLLMRDDAEKALRRP